MKFKNRLGLAFKIACFLVLTGFLTSCNGPKKSTADYLYFQYGPNLLASQQKETVIYPNDLLSIQVYSKTLNQEQARIFNMPTIPGPIAGVGSTTEGATMIGAAAATGGPSQGYQVSVAGNIEFPVLGSIQVAGLTKNQLQNLLIEKITNYVKNPAVIIRFLNFNINVLGEVKAPGIKTFSADRVTIIDALSAANDLTDAGRREDITVIREQEGKKVFYAIDLRSRSVFESPVYFLQPNDIVYVKPNEYKLKTLNVDPDIQRKTSLFTTALGIVVSLATLIVIILR